MVSSSTMTAQIVVELIVFFATTLGLLTIALLLCFRWIPATVVLFYPPKRSPSQTTTNGVSSSNSATKVTTAKGTTAFASGNIFNDAELQRQREEQDEIERESQWRGAYRTCMFLMTFFVIECILFLVLKSYTSSSTGKKKDKKTHLWLRTVLVVVLYAISLFIAWCLRTLIFKERHDLDPYSLRRQAAAAKAVVLSGSILFLSRFVPLLIVMFLVMGRSTEKARDIVAATMTPWFKLLSIIISLGLAAAAHHFTFTSPIYPSKEDRPNPYAAVATPHGIETSNKSNGTSAPTRDNAEQKSKAMTEQTLLKLSALGWAGVTLMTVMLATLHNIASLAKSSSIQKLKNAIKKNTGVSTSTKFLASLSPLRTPTVAIVVLVVVLLILVLAWIRLTKKRSAAESQARVAAENERAFAEASRPVVASAATTTTVEHGVTNATYQPGAARKEKTRNYAEGESKQFVRSEKTSGQKCSHNNRNDKKSHQRHLASPSLYPSLASCGHRSEASSCCSPLSLASESSGSKPKYIGSSSPSPSGQREEGYIEEGKGTSRKLNGKRKSSMRLRKMRKASQEQGQLSSGGGGGGVKDIIRRLELSHKDSLPISMSDSKLSQSSDDDGHGSQKSRSNTSGVAVRTIKEDEEGLAYTREEEEIERELAAAKEKRRAVRREKERERYGHTVV